MVQSFVNEFGTVGSFLYNLEDLRTAIKKESALKAKAIAVDDSMFDKLVITDDELTWLNETLRTVCSNVYNIFQRFSKSFSEAYKYDAEIYDDDDQLLGNYVIYSLIIGDNFDVNIFEPVDRNAELAIKYSVLNEWFKMINQFETAQYYEVQFEDTYDKARSKLLMSMAKSLKPAMPPFG